MRLCNCTKFNGFFNIVFRYWECYYDFSIKIDMQGKEAGTKVFGLFFIFFLSKKDGMEVSENVSGINAEQNNCR